MDQSLFSNLRHISKELLSLLLLVSGYIACLSLGALIAYSLLGQSELGIEYSQAILNMTKVPVIDEIRIPLVFANWCALGIVVAWTLYEAGRNIIRLNDSAHHFVDSDIKSGPHLRLMDGSKGFKKAGNS